MGALIDPTSDQGPVLPSAVGEDSLPPEPRRPLALDGGMLRRSLEAALVVGTVLTLLNHGDLIFAGAFPRELWWKVPLTYLVPFLVATYGALGAKKAL